MKSCVEKRQHFYMLTKFNKKKFLKKFEKNYWVFEIEFFFTNIFFFVEKCQY